VEYQNRATFVARSFSGDKKQLQAIMKTAIAHKGLSVIDVISPCVTFNDHQGSTKSYGYMREHEAVLHELDFVPFFQEIDVDIPEGVVMEVEMHDGSHLRIRKLERTYDPTNRLAAGAILEEAEAKGEVGMSAAYILWFAEEARRECGKDCVVPLVADVTAELNQRFSRDLRDPRVQVAIRAYASERVFVGGEVNNAGLYTIPGRIGVMEAIMMANGFMDTAQSQKSPSGA